MRDKVTSIAKPWRPFRAAIPSVRRDVGSGAPDALSTGQEDRFLKTGEPRDLTLVFAAGRVTAPAFSEHWRRVHGPLALRVEAMRAYRQNHILARLPAHEGDSLHRVDGISQLWFDDIGFMRMAMESAEQRACVEDIREFLSDVTILIQQEGEKRQHGGVNWLPVKFLYLLAGPEAAMKTMEDRLFADLAASFANAALRVNPIVDRGFSVDPTVSAGGQVIDAILELWLPQGTYDAVAQHILSESPDMEIIGASRVDELILKEA